MQLSADSLRAHILGTMLRDARERVSISQRELSRRLNVANSTIGRWENGSAAPSAETVARALDCIDNVENAVREDLLSLAGESDDGDWLNSGPLGITPQLAGLMKFERMARRISQWSPLTIPGVLQTSDYARAMLSAQMSPNLCEARVNLRMARRDSVTRRRNPVALLALIGEPAIRGGIGGPDVMSDELGYLIEVAKSPNITLRVVKTDTAWHPGHSGPFMIYEFARLPSFVYLENHRSGAFLTEDHDVREFHTAATTIQTHALTESDSLDLISSLAR
jgi:DNA-binding XRE family transcriptional regulator